MKKKILGLILIFTTIISITGCTTKNTDAIKFKDDYESLNSKTSSYGTEYRNLSISEDNPFVYITAEELVEKMDNNETFYVYFGSKLCPWCRSTIETAIKVSKEKGIDKIYYVDIWDDKGTEILRDKYIINDNNELEQTIKGTSAYYKLLDRFDSLLAAYTITDSEGNQVEVGEKRIFAPNFIYVEKGIAKKLVSGTSDKQESATSELTKEVLKDQENIFSDFFIK